MTRSELFSVMTVGMATVAGSVLVGYGRLGVPLDYLLAATFMTAPSGLMMAKMVVPETEDATLTDSPRAIPIPSPRRSRPGTPATTGATMAKTRSRCGGTRGPGSWSGTTRWTGSRRWRRGRRATIRSTSSTPPPAGPRRGCGSPPPSVPC